MIIVRAMTSMPALRRTIPVWKKVPRSVKLLNRLKLRFGLAPKPTGMHMKPRKQSTTPTMRNQVLIVCISSGIARIAQELLPPTPCFQKKVESVVGVAWRHCAFRLDLIKNNVGGLFLHLHKEDRRADRLF